MLRLLTGPVSLGEIGGAPGIDLTGIEKPRKRNLTPLSIETRRERELDTLKNIRDHLTQARASIRNSGNIFKINIKRLPARLLEEAKRRLAILLRGSRKLVRNFTNAKRKYMYRCSLPGCGGTILNEHSVKRVSREHCPQRYHPQRPHCRAFRETLDLKKLLAPVGVTQQEKYDCCECHKERKRFDRRWRFCLNPFLRRKID